VVVILIEDGRPYAHFILLLTCNDRSLLTSVSRHWLSDRHVEFRDMSLIRETRFRFAERVTHQRVEEAFDPRVRQFRHFHLDEHVPRRGNHACVVLGLGITLTRGFYAPALDRARDRGNDLLLEPQKQRPHLVTERSAPFE